MSFIKKLSLCFKRWCFLPKTLCALSTMSPCQFGEFYSFLKLPWPLIHRSCLILWSFLSLWADGVLANFGFRRLQRLFFAQVVSSLCGGWALGLSFTGRTKLFKSKAEWINVSTTGRGLWEKCVYVCVCVLVWFYWGEPMKYVLKSWIAFSVFSTFTLTRSRNNFISKWYRLYNSYSLHIIIFHVILS